MEGEPEPGTAVQLETGFGKLKVPWNNLLELRYDPTSSLWTLRTDKMTATGRVGEGVIGLDTPAGRIAVPLSEIAELQSPAAPAKK